eukprot:gene163-4409_t
MEPLSEEEKSSYIGKSFVVVSKVSTKIKKETKSLKAIENSVNGHKTAVCEFNEYFDLTIRFNLKSFYGADQLITFCIKDEDSKLSYVSTNIGDFVQPFYSEENSMKKTVLFPFETTDKFKGILKVSFATLWMKEFGEGPMKSPRKSTTRFVVIEEGEQTEIELPEIEKEEKKKYDVRKHSTLQSFGSAPNFTKKSSLHNFKQNDKNENVPKIDLTRLSANNISDEKKKKNSPKSSTPKTPSSEASEFASKITEYKGIIRGLEKEKKELKEKLNGNSNSNDTLKSNETHKIINELKNEFKLIKENNIETNEILSNLKLRLSIFENEKKGFTSYSHNPIQNQVTIVCCDIEGNSNLWNLTNEEMKETISLYSEMIKEKANETLGYISPSDTDSFIVAFSSIRKAIKFCLLCQISLMELNWPKELIKNEKQPDLFFGLRCRMGVDSGIPEYIVDDSSRVKYFGDIVHKASIITSYTQGGQVIISEGAWDALCQSKEKSDTPIRTVVQDLGAQDLKGINKKEHVRLIIPEQFKGRKFKSKSLQLVWNDSSMLVGISKEISNIKFNHLNNQNLIEFENKLTNILILNKLIEDSTGSESNLEIKIKQDELDESLRDLKNQNDHLKEKYLKLESQISKLNSSIMFYGGGSSSGTTNNESKKITKLQTLGTTNSTTNFDSNIDFSVDSEELKTLKENNDTSIDQLKKLLELANSAKEQLEEELKKD